MNMRFYFGKVWPGVHHLTESGAHGVTRPTRLVVLNAGPGQNLAAERQPRKRCRYGN